MSEKRIRLIRKEAGRLGINLTRSQRKRATNVGLGKLLESEQ